MIHDKTCRSTMMLGFGILRGKQIILGMRRSSQVPQDFDPCNARAFSIFRPSKRIFLTHVNYFHDDIYDKDISHVESSTLSAWAIFHNNFLSQIKIVILELWDAVQYHITHIDPFSQGESKVRTSDCLVLYIISLLKIRAVYTWLCLLFPIFWLSI